MISIIDYLFESWGQIPRTLYIHKLVKCGDYTKKSIDKLVELDIFDNNKDIYIYSFIHPDNNVVTSFVGSKLLKPGVRNMKLWFAPASPFRAIIYKGSTEGTSLAGFSAEKISSDKFETSSFLFSGEKSTFKKVADVGIDIVSTTVPIPFVAGVIIYENYEMDLDKGNSLKLNSIKITRLKAVTLPQLFMKSNYMFVFKCEAW